MKPDCISKGWILDDFPRNRVQAAALSFSGIVPDVFIYLDVPKSRLSERVTGRRVDPLTGHIYHLKYNPPKGPIITSRLQQRSDDNYDTFTTRYDEYMIHIDNVKFWYADKLLDIDGSAAPFCVSHQILTALDDDYYTVATQYVQGEDQVSVVYIITLLCIIYIYIY